LEDTGPFAWNYGASYRLRLTLDHHKGKARIRAEVFEGETPRFRCVRALDGKAVDHGRPALLVNSLPASFDDVAVSIETKAPPAAPKTFPAFRSSPLAGKPTHKAAGFFRVEKTGDTWWLIDPAGKPTLSIGTDHVNYQTHWCEALGFAPYHKVVEKKFGSEKAWAKDAVARLLEWNFTTLGTNPSQEACRNGLANAEAVGFGASFSSVAALVEKTTWTGFPDVFDPRFERFCDLRARNFCAPRRDDPWLIGYYIDNELEWWGKSHGPWGLVESTAKLPASAAGKVALVASLRRSFANDIGAFNAAFSSRFPGFEQMLPSFDLPQPATDKAKAALDAFITEVAERYFRITTAAVRRHDPNHMLLGCRFAHDTPEPAWRQAGANCEIVTVNVYPRVDLRSAEVIGFEEHLKAKFKSCQRPMILTEWGFPSLDAVDRNEKPLPCTQGAGMRVDTVEQKARCYAAVQRALFALPFMVGSHYFMWSDEPALGISTSFPENSSYGLVNEADEPYGPLVKTATRVNARMVDLHAGKIRAEDIDPGDATTPEGKVPPLPVIGNEVRLEQNAAGYVIDTGALRTVKDAPGDAIFNRIQWRASASDSWTELGAFTCVLNALKGTVREWPHPDQAPKLTVVSQSTGKLVVDVECQRAAAPAFRACERLTFHAGRPFFEARMRWIENSGDAPWRLDAYLHYLPSNIGGNPASDELGVSAVPNYWLKVATWRDPQLALHYGAFVRNNDQRMESHFWKDSVQHPDCMRKIGHDLTPKQRWTADGDEPSLIVFGLKETPGNPRPWRDLLPMIETTK
jgi:agarase